MKVIFIPTSEAIVALTRVKNNIRPLMLFFILFFSLSALSKTNSNFEQKHFGNYVVTIWQPSADSIGKVTIRQGLNIVFEESEIGDYYYFGNNFDESLKEKDPHSGKDITGNKIPNLVISTWTGGAHCCRFLHVFELGKKFRKITTVEANSSSVRLVDLDNDGFPEIEFYDGAIDYIFTSFGDSPGGRVVLKFKNGQYEVAANLMKKTFPSIRQMEKLKNKIKLAFEKENDPVLPYDFLNAMMMLSYSGNFAIALKTTDEVWPEKKPGLQKFKKEFQECLQESHYWKNLKQNQ